MPVSYLTYLHLLQTPSNHVLGGRNLANPVVNLLAVCMYLSCVLNL